jgi:hypothetical protein
MIKLRDRAIMLREPGGSSRVFDRSELEARIIKSFLDSGAGDAALASEMTLAIEHALCGSADDSDVTTTTAENINSLTARVLEQCGFPRAAALFSFGGGGAAAEAGVDTNPESVASALAKHLDFQGRGLDAAALKTASACAALGIEKAPPHLIYELGKYYRDTSAPPPPAPPAGKAAAPPAPEKIAAALSGGARRLVSSGVLGIRTGRFFPCVRLSFHLTGPSFCGDFQRPLSELVLIPAFGPVADAAGEIHAAALSWCGEGLVFAVEMTDLSLFAESFMGISFPDSRELCARIAEAFHETLPVGVLKTVWK